MKANKSDIDRLNDIKCNKIEVELMHNSVSVLSKQFKHILVLFMESIKGSLMNAHETQIAKDTKKKFLLS
jgi:hypothetical protein